MTKYKKEFLKGLNQRRRTQYREMIRRGRAYLERAEDGSQLLIIADPGGMDEAIWAAVPDADEARCIGNRVR
jgi:hypothetical protein